MCSYSGWQAEGAAGDDGGGVVPLAEGREGGDHRAGRPRNGTVGH